MRAVDGSAPPAAADVRGAVTSSRWQACGTAMARRRHRGSKRRMGIRLALWVSGTGANPVPPEAPAPCGAVVTFGAELIPDGALRHRTGYCQAAAGRDEARAPRRASCRNPAGRIVVE